MMIGLPESTRNDEINTAKELIKLKPKIVRIYPVLVLKNTKLEKQFNEGTYTPLSLVKAIEICKELVQIFRNKNINVIRIGLQTTEEISSQTNETSQVVAGPYHPAFRQLVESNIWYDRIFDKIKRFNVKVKEVKITANPSDVNDIVGHKKENLKKLKEMYDVDVILVQDEKMKKNDLKIEITKTYSDFLEENKKPSLNH